MGATVHRQTDRRKAMFHHAFYVQMADVSSVVQAGLMAAMTHATTTTGSRSSTRSDGAHASLASGSYILLLEIKVKSPREDHNLRLEYVDRNFWLLRS